MYTLYDSKLSGNAWKIRQALQLLDLPYERRSLNLAAGEAHSDAFLGLNPWGRVPVLVHADGRVFRESNAILWHLAQGTALVPQEAMAQQRMLEWLFIEQADHFKNFAMPRFLVAIARSHGLDAPDIVAMRAQGHKVLEQMESHLARHPFMAGEAPSIADIALFPYTRMAPAGGYELQGYTHLNAWLERIEAMPGFLALPQ